MSSVSITKSKDLKAGKEQKTPLKSSVVVNGGSGLPSSAYNPLMGTFHTLDISSTSSTQILHGNGHFQNVDDSENHSTHGSGGEFDSASNNDTQSVESEEQNTEKSNAPNKPEIIPGSDNDKREKIRQRNEKKHQRQKERRAQELHERCSGYLMSRKLEALAQQLVSMGFSQERATMALILNEGRVEEAVAWLFEGGEDSDTFKAQNLDTGNNVKIDISEELARIADLEIKYKYSKQEVERVIVSCEGDLEKSEKTLRSQKQDQPAISPKPEINAKPSTCSSGKIPVASASQSNMSLLIPNSKPVLLLPQRKDDKVFNDTKPTITVGLTQIPATRLPPKLAPQQIATPAKNGWPSSPSISSSLAPSRQASSPVSNVESLKNLQLGSMREPVVMLQRPQNVNTQITSAMRISSPPTGGAVSWYPTSSEAMKPNGILSHVPSTRSPSPNNLAPNQFYHPAQNQQQQVFYPGSIPMGNVAPTRVSGSSSTLAATSSLGLFSGLGSISPVDWNASNSMPSCDYTSIDWSLDTSFLPSKPNSLWAGLGGPYSRSNGHMYDSGGSTTGINLGMRSFNGNGVPVVGLQDGKTLSSDPMAASSREWTSPFEGKDLFSLPRQFAFSPSL